MVYIEYNLVAPDKGQVFFQMFKPELLPAERKQSGLLVDAIPEPDESQGSSVLFVNPETKELSYEYFPIPEPPLYPDTIEGQLQKQIDDLKLLVAQLIAGGTVQ